MRPHALAYPLLSTRMSDYLQLTKPRLNLLVVFTTGVGYWLGVAGHVDPARLFHAVVGTALVAGGSAAFNQLYEQDVDALMSRTRLRPLPDGRLTPWRAFIFGLVLSALGLVQLSFGVNHLSAIVAFATLLSYVVWYTPMKRRSSLSTVVGAIPGALPPVIGWAAATGTLSREAWLLFAIVFLWQMPHFLSLAWLFREEYERAGFQVLPVVEPTGRSTARQTVIYTAALIPVSLGPALTGLAGPVYFAVALVLGIAFLVLALRFSRDLHRRTARQLFLGSLVYLPLIWLFMIATRVP
ncbi:Protoheme IX farnesyltransferase 2 [Luteitalea pratensis]|uniref:Protoheme IX farnesyltransferase n=1 Tax=Luteitalea pratensis TaxID=1855912 RepID=A0A143PWD0_LUTPR|nr:heme o synthase [Luteitalea pratensis]AMY12681.1 Protoheme IX farnesyltransferase 2 [Luteitalea pratensis]